MEFQAATQEQIEQPKITKWSQFFQALQTSPTRAVALSVNGDAVEALDNTIRAGARARGLKVSIRKLSSDQLLVTLRD